MKRVKHISAFVASGGILVLLNLERALYFSSDPVIFTTLGKDYTLFGKVDPEKMERGEFLLKMAKYMQPGHYFPRYLLIQLYERINDEEKKKEEAAVLLSLDTKVVSEAVDEMRLVAREILDETLYKINVNPTSVKNKE